MAFKRKACFWDVEKTSFGDYLWIHSDAVNLREPALSASHSSRHPCQSRSTQTGQTLHSCRLGAQCFRTTLGFSTAKALSHWHSIFDEPAEQQWSRPMERHGNSRHLARVHPTSSLSPPSSPFSSLSSPQMLEHISLRLTESPREQIMGARQSK